MRLLAVALLALPLLAGCSGGEVVPGVGRLGDGDWVAYRATPDGLVAVDLPAPLRSQPRPLVVDTGHDGAEPTIGVAPDGTLFAVAYEKVLRSRDGLAWEVVHEMTIGDFSGDPMLWVDPQTGRVLNPQLFPQDLCSNLAWSDDGGATWTETPVACGTPLIDHPKIATGEKAGPFALLPTPYPQMVSLCHNKQRAGADGGTWCGTSIDGGITFTHTVQVDMPPGAAPADPPPCGGLAGHQHHAADGSIHVPYGFECRSAYVATSVDGGLSWTRRRLGQPQMEIDPEVASTPDGTLYYLYRGDDQRVHLLRSRDGWATVEGPFTVSPSDLDGTAFLGMAAGRDGRLAMAYLGNGQSSQRPDDAPDGTVWHLYVTLSFDADTEEPTFSTVRATPDPVQRGSICIDLDCSIDEPGGTSDRNLLDFIDLSRGPDGRFWVAFTDGCRSAQCTADGRAAPATSRDDRFTVATLHDGPRLL